MNWSKAFAWSVIIQLGFGCNEEMTPKPEPTPNNDLVKQIDKLNPEELLIIPHQIPIGPDASFALGPSSRSPSRGPGSRSTPSSTPPPPGPTNPTNNTSSTNTTPSPNTANPTAGADSDPMADKKVENDKADPRNRGLPLPNQTPDQVQAQAEAAVGKDNVRREVDAIYVRDGNSVIGYFNTDSAKYQMQYTLSQFQPSIEGTLVMRVGSMFFLAGIAPEVPTGLPDDIIQEIKDALAEGRPGDLTKLGYDASLNPHFNRELDTFRTYAQERSQGIQEAQAYNADSSKGDAFLAEYKDVKPRNPAKFGDVLTQIHARASPKNAIDQATFTATVDGKQVKVTMVKIGQGGHGVTYKVTLGNEVFAIKIGAIEALEANATIAVDQAFGPDFPSASVYHFDDNSIVMDFFNAADGRNLTFDQAMNFLGATNMLHDQGIYHGDIKAENTVYTNEGLKFIDFGRTTTLPVSIAFGAQPPEALYSRRWVDIRIGEYYTVGRALAETKFPDLYAQALEETGAEAKPGYAGLPTEGDNQLEARAQLKREEDIEVAFARALSAKIDQKVANGSQDDKKIAEMIKALLAVDPVTRDRNVHELFANPTSIK